MAGLQLSLKSGSDSSLVLLSISFWDHRGFDVHLSCLVFIADQCLVKISIGT